MLDEALARVHEIVEGARTVALVALDGVVVASEGEREDPDLDVVAASYPDLFRKVAAAHAEAGLPPPTELIVRGVDATVVLRAVDSDYALLAVLGERGSLGRARFELAKAAAAVRPEVEGA